MLGIFIMWSLYILFNFSLISSSCSGLFWLGSMRSLWWTTIRSFLCSNGIARQDILKLNALGKLLKPYIDCDIPQEKEEIWYSCRWYMPGSISHLTNLGHGFIGYRYWVLYHLCFLLSNIYPLRTQVYTLLSSHQVVSFLSFSVCSGLVISLISTCFICDNNAEEVPTWVLAGSTLRKYSSVFFFFF